VTRGERLIVVTSLTESEAHSADGWQVPDPDGCFDGLTGHVYRLSWLFPNEQHRCEFLRYLIWRYRVHTVMTAGCEFLDRMLSDLQSEFSEITVADQTLIDNVNCSRAVGNASQSHTTKPEWHP